MFSMSYNCNIADGSTSSLCYITATWAFFLIVLIRLGTTQFAEVNKLSTLQLHNGQRLYTEELWKLWEKMQFFLDGGWGSWIFLTFFFKNSLVHRRYSNRRKDLCFNNLFQPDHFLCFEYTIFLIFGALYVMDINCHRIIRDYQSVYYVFNLWFLLVY